jgi:hypothetical protein
MLAMTMRGDSVPAAGETNSCEIFPFPGGRCFHLKDADGHVLAVWPTAELFVADSSTKCNVQK